MSAAPQTIHVNLAERSYDIEIGGGILSRLGKFVAERGRTTHAVLITDENVQEPYAMRATESLVREGIDVDLIAVPPGETSKSIEAATDLWRGMLDLGTDRKSIVVAVGGGVVGDLAGFVAATFARGLRFFQAPTSLLAQVDSSVGGKVGINLPEAKNMVGAFHQPAGVLIDTSTLATLPANEYRSGLAEVVKYGVILDADFFAYLEAHAAEINARREDALTHVIARCCRLKAEVVRHDEREETGLRAVLNYGHTFGHAFESLSGYGKLLHGEGVAIGMCCAARLARRLGRVDDGFVESQNGLLESFGLPTAVPSLDREKILEAMRRDKKVQHGKLKFVLPNRLGHVESVGDIDEKEIEAALEVTGQTQPPLMLR
ncbi:MAG: 3-dehydroquinate synthase [Pirellulales bacterium]|nr:3-dehydroquinate synthase [Pirellulales bacterium]